MDIQSILEEKKNAGQELEQNIEKKPEQKPEKKPDKKPKESFKWTKKNKITIGVIAGVVVLILLLFGIGKENDTYMEPGLKAGGHYVYCRLKFGLSRGDRVVTKDENGDKAVRRIAGTAGEIVQVDVTTGILYVNGEAIEESYLHEYTSVESGDAKQPYKVKKGEYYLLQDWRATANDSRNTKFGAKKKSQIKGKVLFTF